MRIRNVVSILALAIAAGCSQSGDAAVAAPPPVAAAQALAPAPRVDGDRPGTAPESASRPEVLPAEKFTDGARAFATIKQAMLGAYYDKGLTEDDLYRAAARGMLEHADPAMEKWNKLMAPAEVAAMKSDLKGEIVGVGVEIRFNEETGYTEVLGIVPGSPAEKAHISPGDTIVTVNGKLYKGWTLHDIVADIRGKAGEPVTLAILRGDKLVSVPIVREVVAYDAVTHMELPRSVGYVRIRHFSAKTPSMLKAALEDLAAKGTKALVLDVRGNSGGAFDEAVASAELLLPAGTPIVNVDKRGAQEKIVAKGEPILAGAPIAILVDHDTASGAELVTAALQEARHATIIGARTFGKWSVQKVDDLPNGYAFKYTVGIFRTASGKSYGGAGLSPDVEVGTDEKAFAKACALSDPQQRLAADAPLRTAATILGRP